MAKMTKSQIVTALSEKTGLAKKEVNGFFDALAGVAYKEVKQPENLFSRVLESW